MTSLSFDPVAHMYDATRGYPEAVARQVTESIERAANGNAQTRFLEIGVGTGRIAFPLASAGHNYTGIDISKNMLYQFEEKLRAASWQEVSLSWGSLPDENTERKPEVQRFQQAEKQGVVRLVVSDMTDLPFHIASFDAVIAVHVFHLVSDWQQAVQEVLRVLQPGGSLIMCWQRDWTEELNGKPAPLNIRREWNRIAQELGAHLERPGVSAQFVMEWLQQKGASAEIIAEVPWKQAVRPRAVLEAIEQRLWSGTWSVPDDLFATSIKRLRQWANEHYGAAIDDEHEQERVFVISRTRMM
ncbi:MAG TPA: methyltransferase domain-containing protein [Ktedonobacteraceae bacterium]|jgi:ubiquinone/menaquinone biosynthesis C-methylase UbiE